MKKKVVKVNKGFNYVIKIWGFNWKIWSNYEQLLKSIKSKFSVSKEIKRRKAKVPERGPHPMTFSTRENPRKIGSFYARRLKGFRYHSPIKWGEMGCPDWDVPRERGGGGGAFFTISSSHSVSESDRGSPSGQTEKTVAPSLSSPVCKLGILSLDFFGAPAKFNLLFLWETPAMRSYAPLSFSFVFGARHADRLFCFLTWGPLDYEAEGCAPGQLVY